MVDQTPTTLYHVYPLAGGRWEVRQEDGTSMIYDDKQRAVTAAVELCRTGAPGVVKIHGLDGSVESERAVR